MAHKLLGSLGGFPGSQVLCQIYKKSDYLVEDRQHDNGSIHQQPGRDSVPLNEQNCKESVAMVSSEAEHLPGMYNTIADEESRVIKDRSDWMLNTKVFQAIQRQMGPLSVDLFASRPTTQLPNFFSWRPDPEAKACNAFFQDWRNIQGLPYANPPWSLVGKVVNKAIQQKATLVLVSPV